MPEQSEIMGPSWEECHPVKNVVSSAVIMLGIFTPEIKPAAADPGTEK